MGVAFRRLVAAAALVTGGLVAAASASQSVAPLPPCWTYTDGSNDPLKAAAPRPYLAADGTVLFSTPSQTRSRPPNSPTSSLVFAGIPYAADATGRWVLVFGTALVMHDRVGGSDTPVSDFQSIYGFVLSDGDIVFDTPTSYAASDTDAVRDVYRWDRETNTYTLVIPDSLSPASATSRVLASSADGSVLVVDLGVLLNGKSVVILDVAAGSSPGPAPTNPSWALPYGLMPSGNFLLKDSGQPDVLKRYDPRTATTVTYSFAGAYSFVTDAVSANSRYVLLSKTLPLVDGAYRPFVAIFDLDTATASWLGFLNSGKSSGANLQGFDVSDDGTWALLIADSNPVIVRAGTPFILAVEQPGFHEEPSMNATIGRGAMATDEIFGVNLTGAEASGTDGLVVSDVVHHDDRWIDLTSGTGLDQTKPSAQWVLTVPGVCRSPQLVDMIVADVRSEGAWRFPAMVRPGSVFQGDLPNTSTIGQASLSGDHLSDTPTSEWLPWAIPVVSATVDANAPPGWIDLTVVSHWRGSDYPFEVADPVLVRSPKGEFVAKPSVLLDTAHDTTTRKRKMTSTTPRDINAVAKLSEGGSTRQNVEAVVVQAMVTGATKASTLTLGPPGQPGVTMAYRTAHTNVTTLVVPVDANGFIHVGIGAGSAHVQLRTVGYFGAREDASVFGGAFLSHSPIRVFDTTTWGYGKLDKKHYAAVPIFDVQAPVGAVALSVTVSNAKAAGKIVVGDDLVFPSYQTNVAYNARETVSTLVITPPAWTGGGSKGVFITLAGGSADIAIDYLGYWDDGTYPITSGQFVFTSPVTKFTGAAAAGPITLSVANLVPADAEEVLVEITATAPLGGSVGVYPGDVTPSPMTKTVAWWKKTSATSQTIVRLSPTKTITMNPTTSGTYTLKILGWTTTR